MNRSIKTALAALAMTGLAAGAAVAERRVVREVKTYCRGQWPGNYRMQLYCFNRNAKAANQLSAMLRRYQRGTPEYDIIYRCLFRWEVKPSFNYPMVVYCTRRELRARQALRN